MPCCLQNARTCCWIHSTSTSVFTSRICCVSILKYICLRFCMPSGRYGCVYAQKLSWLLEEPSWLPQWICSASTEFLRLSLNGPIMRNYVLSQSSLCLLTQLWNLRLTHCGFEEFSPGEIPHRDTVTTGYLGKQRSNSEMGADKSFSCNSSLAGQLSSQIKEERDEVMVLS